eukprot:1161195-Pelagomonas_calceolata.AAC.5
MTSFPTGCPDNAASSLKTAERPASWSNLAPGMGEVEPPARVQGKKIARNEPSSKPSWIPSHSHVERVTELALDEKLQAQ